jgi:hypothetical protein
LGDNALAQPADSRDGSILETPMLLAWKNWMNDELITNPQPNIDAFEFHTISNCSCNILRCVLAWFRHWIRHTNELERFPLDASA